MHSITDAGITAGDANGCDDRCSITDHSTMLTDAEHQLAK